MPDKIWETTIGVGPLIATAVHASGELRSDVANYIKLDKQQRLREEDPFTDIWTKVAPTQVVGLRSRFEVDLNRARDIAVYRKPEDAWGLSVWKDNPPASMFEESLAEYDAFYEAMEELLQGIVDKHGHFVVYDLHTYNHRRDGADGPEADPEGNPQVNLGTATMNRDRWAPVVDAFVDSLREFDFPGGKLDVRENVKFKGGNWSRWIHEKFPETGVSIAIEYKKFFMDEWSGEPHPAMVEAITDSLNFTTPAVLKALKNL